MFTRIFIGLLTGGAIGAVMGYYGKCSSGACPLTANPYRGAVYGAVVAALMVVSLGVKPNRASTGSANIDQNQEVKAMNIEIESSSEFQKKVSDASGVIMVDFFSHSCPPCKALGPVVSKLAEKYEGKAGIYKVDVEKNMELAQKWGIQKIPAVVILKDGKEVERKIGLRPESEYAGALDKLLAEVG
jgi:thioredoxin 1